MNEPAKDVVLETPDLESGAPKEKIRELADEIAAKHRKPRRDKGTKRGPRLENNAEPRVENPPLVDEASVRKGVSSLLKAVDSVLVRKVFTASMIITKDETFSRGMAAQLAMSGEENDLIASLSATVCVKHAILGQYAPEILLVLAVGGYAARAVSIFRSLEDMAREQAKAKP